LTFCLSLWPATDQTLLATPPIVHLPVWKNRTPVGPRLNLPEPRASGLEAVGSERAGPTPQVTALALAGDQNKLRLVSPIPKVESISPWGTLLTGMIVRAMMFHFSR